MSCTVFLQVGYLARLQQAVTDPTCIRLIRSKNYGSGSSDPFKKITDPDPTFVSQVKIRTSSNKMLYELLNIPNIEK
jgi:hypothetical protein